MTTPKQQINIGGLSKATGIPISTLRTWERRYNFPEPDRTEGNHRLYDVIIIEHLTLIAEALTQGHRAGQILGLSFAELEQLLGKEDPCCGDSEIDCWHKAVQSLDLESLLGGFQISLARLGLQRFVTERVVPFIAKVGQDWSDGKLPIFQEHFATNHLSAFLQSQWRLLNNSNQGRTVTLIAHPQEIHLLGLQMVACMLTLEGFRVHLLGNNTPVEDIVNFSKTTSSSAIVMSCSITMASKVEAFVLELKDHLQQSHLHIPIFVGGLGSEDMPLMDQVHQHSDLENAAQCLKGLLS